MGAADRPAGRPTGGGGEEYWVRRCGGEGRDAHRVALASPKHMDSLAKIAARIVQSVDKVLVPLPSEAGGGATQRFQPLPGSHCGFLAINSAVSKLFACHVIAEVTSPSGGHRLGSLPVYRTPFMVK